MSGLGSNEGAENERAVNPNYQVTSIGINAFEDFLGF